MARNSREPSDRQARLDRVAADAESDSGVDRAFLGGFLGDTVRVIVTGHRLSPRRVLRYESQGEQAASDGVALSALVDLYLSAAWRLWREVPALTAESANGVRPAPLRDAVEGMLRTSDDVVAAAATGYQRAHTARLAQLTATRREFIDDLLSNHGPPGELTTRAEAFGLQLGAGHRVAVVRLADQRIEESNILLGYASETCRALPGAPASLVTSKDGNLVVLLEGDESDTRAGVARVAAALREAAPHLRLGVGRSRAGEAGPMRSLREAVECVQLADRLGVGADGAYADDLIAYLALARDPELLVELVASVLGPLTSLRGGAREGVATLQAYVDNLGSATATAQALHLSVRGLTYRIERIQALLSHDLDDPHQRFTVELALLAARLLNWPANEPPVVTAS